MKVKPGRGQFRFQFRFRCYTVVMWLNYGLYSGYIVVIRGYMVISWLYNVYNHMARGYILYITLGEVVIQCVGSCLGVRLDRYGLPCGAVYRFRRDPTMLTKIDLPYFQVLFTFN